MHDHHGKKLIVGNGETIEIKNLGTVRIPCSNKEDTIKLKNVLLAPHINKRLVSVAKLTADGNFIVEFYKNGCVVKDKVI